MPAAFVRCMKLRMDPFCAEYVNPSSWTRLRRRIVYTEKKAEQGTAGHRRARI